MEYDYPLCSDAFTQSAYYIVQGHADNYKHLVGIGYTGSPDDFYRHCIDGTLQETDISFDKGHQPPSAVKGTVRHKIQVLPDMANIFSAGSMVE